MSKQFFIGAVLVAAVVAGWMFTKHKTEVHEESFSSFANPPISPQNLPPKNPTSGKNESTPEKITPLLGVANLPGIHSEQEFRQHFKGQWQFLRHGETIHSILGGPIPGYPNSPAGAAHFAQEVAPLFGVDPQEIDSTHMSTVETPLRQAYHFGQTFDGMPVYQGEIAVFYLKDTGEISLLNSELQPFDNKAAGPTMSPRQASDTLEANQEWKNAHVSNVQGVVLYVKDHVAVPAYVMTAVTGSPQETWEVVVSGTNGEILHRHPRNPDEDRKL